jgi:hypothetical protein
MTQRQYIITRKVNIVKLGKKLETSAMPAEKQVVSHKYNYDRGRKSRNAFAYAANENSTTALY